MNSFFYIRIGSRTQRIFAEVFTVMTVGGKYQRTVFTQVKQEILVGLGGGTGISNR